VRFPVLLYGKALNLVGKYPFMFEICGW